MCADRDGAVPGLRIEPAPPLPQSVQPPGWAGYCTFNTPGTYSFFCGAHGDMTGTVVVGSGNPTPTPTPTRDAVADRDADSHRDADSDADGDSVGRADRGA